MQLLCRLLRYVLPVHVFISIEDCSARQWRRLETARQLLDLDAVLVGGKMQTKTDVCTVRRLFIISAKEVMFYPASVCLSVRPSVCLQLHLKSTDPLFRKILP